MGREGEYKMGGYRSGWQDGNALKVCFLTNELVETILRYYNLWNIKHDYLHLCQYSVLVECT
jgi:hypothetical protein